MSGYRVHIAGYIAFEAILLAILSYYKIGLAWDTIILGSLAGGIYSILPDVDAPSSKIRTAVERISLISLLFSLISYIFLRFALLIYAAIILALFLLSLYLVRHRGIFHTVWMGFILSMPLYIINPQIAGFAFLGFLSHIIIDGIL